MSIFEEIWNSKNQYEQYNSYKKATSKAKKILYKQKSRTGVGILGTPPRPYPMTPSFKESLGTKAYVMVRLLPSLL